MRRRIAFLAALSILLRVALAAAVEPAVPAAATRPQVQTDAGRVIGTAAGGVAFFLGIPYAAPPVGELRWRAPRPVAPWLKPRIADGYGSDCMQLPYPGDSGPPRTRPAEDCLYLNVWVPARRSEGPLPVMVWIPGGGFVNGGSSPAVNDGSALARRGAMLVSLNYRLGRFGFFAHPALARETAGAPWGNWGFLDQIAALDWVRRNAAAFGGDPGNVTIFGESAGGASVQALMVSPLARGLFHKALVQSGGGRLGGMLAMRPLRGDPVAGAPSAVDAALAFARAARIAGEDAAALAALRALPAERVVDGMTLLAPQPETWSGPMVDGAIVPEDVEPAFRAGRQARVPYVVGTTDREFGFAPIPAERSHAMFAAFGADREAAERAYDPAGAGDRSEMAIQLFSDQAMVEPARLLARLASTTQPTWSYRFAYVASSQRAALPGALHASEVPFAFDTVSEAFGDAATAEDEAMADTMSGYWVDFARAGDPNGGDRPRWPRYTAAEDVILELGVGGPVARPDPRRERLDLVERLASPR